MLKKKKTALKNEQKKVEINTSEKLPDNCRNRKNIGYAIPKAVYDTLGLYDLLKYKQRFINAEYNLNSIFSFLVYNRLLFPSSIKHAYDSKDQFFDSFDFSLEDCYRALDFFDSYSEEIQTTLAQKTKELFGRDPHLGYWDVTNYYFEIPYEDEDKCDDEGNVIKKGQRKRGPSKEHRKDHIVQMGLLMDSKGIPLAFNTFPRNESEKTNMLPTIRRVKRNLDINRIIVVADRGLNTSDNTALLSGKNHDEMEQNDGYVYGLSILMSDKKFKEWVLDQSDYKYDEEIDEHGNKIIFKHKSRVYAKKVTLEDKKGQRRLPTEIYQKQMVYYSEKYAKKQRADRDRIIAKAKDLIENPRNYTRSSSYGAAGYVENIKFCKDTGAVANGQNLSLNTKKIEEEEKYDGYYSIVTSEKDISDSEIRNIYKGLWEIEESFKIIKSEFKARPVYVNTETHINAHFLICFVALVIMRVMEHMTEYRYTTKEIRNSLINYACSYLEQNYYLFDYRDRVTDDFSRKYGWNLSQKYMSQATIKNILKHRKKE